MITKRPINFRLALGVGAVAGAGVGLASNASGTTIMAVAAVMALISLAFQDRRN